MKTLAIHNVNIQFDVEEDRTGKTEVICKQTIDAINVILRERFADCNSAQIFDNEDTDFEQDDLYESEAVQFRQQWLKLFSETTQEELVFLADRVKLRFLRGDSAEVRFFTYSQTINPDDNQYTVEVRVEAESVGGGNVIQVWNDYGNDAGGGTEFVEDFTTPADLVAWLHTHLE